MKVSTHTYSLDKKFGIKRTVDFLAEAGYDALDFSALREEYYTDVYDDAFYRDLRKYAEDKGVYFNQTHAPFDSYFPVEGKSKLRLQNIVTAMKNASLLGAGTIVVHPCQYLEYCEEGSPEKLFDSNIDFYQKLVPFCEEYNIKVALENVCQMHKGAFNHSVCSRAWEFTKYLDALNSEWFVACLDIGHAILVRESPDEFIKVLGGKRLKCLHVHDVDGTRDNHTLPFFGVGDWHKIMKALAEIGYDGELTFEVNSFVAGKPDDLLLDCEKFMLAVGRYLANKFEEYKTGGV